VERNLLLSMGCEAHAASAAHAIPWHPMGSGWHADHPLLAIRCQRAFQLLAADGTQWQQPHCLQSSGHADHPLLTIRCWPSAATTR
jgi:hypothetical protein